MAVVTRRPLTFGSLFAGIGGFDLGFSRAGMTPRWQVECDPYALRVLAKDWPDVPKYRDVRYFLGSKRWRSERWAWAVDILCGGFPCQDISFAGRGLGLEGERSGLWTEFARVIRLLRPRYVVVENVEALVKRGLDRVTGDLAELGYCAEWDVISALSVGAPHLRKRLWIVAYPDSLGRDSGTEPAGWQARRDSDRCGSPGLANALGRQPERWREPGLLAGTPGEGESEWSQRQWIRDAARDRGADLSHAGSARQLQQLELFGEGWGWIGDGGESPLSNASGLGREGSGESRPRQGAAATRRPPGDPNGSPLPDAHGLRERLETEELSSRQPEPRLSGEHLSDSYLLPSGPSGRERLAQIRDRARDLYQWSAQPPVCGMADGVPDRTHRLRCLGNSIVPVIAESIANWIIDFDLWHFEEGA
jgi:site-specific DNA-cytosine methylase